MYTEKVVTKQHIIPVTSLDISVSSLSCMCCTLLSTNIHVASHSWTKETAPSMLQLSTERMVRDNENKGQSNSFKSDVPSARASASNPLTKHKVAPFDVNWTVVRS